MSGRVGPAGFWEDEDYLGRQNPGRPPILGDEDYLGRQNSDRNWLGRLQEYRFEVPERASRQFLLTLGNSFFNFLMAGSFFMSVLELQS